MFMAANWTFLTSHAPGLEQQRNGQWR